MNRALLINSLKVSNQKKIELFRSLSPNNEILKKEQFFDGVYTETIKWLTEKSFFKRAYTTIFDLDYPGYLKNFKDAPFLIFYKGKLNFDPKQSLTVVGTRKPTGNAKQKAYELGLESGLNNTNIISGFAVGIDQASMLGGFDGGGKVCGVLGSGLQYNYPYHTQKAKHRILEQDGCLISQYSPLSPPIPWHFPQRNIILAGLSRNLVVIEASKISGALITASYAYNSATNVFVHEVGSKDTPYCAGSKHLVEQGAPVIKTYSDIFGKSKVKIKKISNNKIECKSKGLFRFLEVCYNVNYEN